MTAVPDHRIGAFFKQDPSLTYKLVRMANVAPMGVRQVESVEHAVAIVGRAAIFRWLALLLAGSFQRGSGVKRELLREALIRAKVCELLAPAARIGQSGHMFLVGLFSRIEALLGVPIESIVKHVVLPQPVSEALTSSAGRYGAVLSLAEAYEDARFGEILKLAEAAGLAAAEVPNAYRQALEWSLEVSRTI